MVYRGHTITNRNGRFHIIFSDSSEWHDTFHSSERAKREIDQWLKTE